MTMVDKLYEGKYRKAVDDGYEVYHVRFGRNGLYALRFDKVLGNDPKNRVPRSSGWKNRYIKDPWVYERGLYNRLVAMAHELERKDILTGRWGPAVVEDEEGK